MDEHTQEEQAPKKKDAGINNGYFEPKPIDDQKAHGTETPKSLTTKILWVIIAAVAILFFVTIFTARGSGNVITETRDISDFTGIELWGVGNIILEQGDAEGMTIEAEDNIVERMNIRVDDGILKIGYKTTWLNWNIWPTKDVNFYITVEDLACLKSSGSGSFTADSLVFDTLEIDINGSGTVDMNVEGSDLHTAVSGSGDVTLAGNVTNHTIDISESGKYYAKDLVSTSATIDISGSGNAEVNAADYLDVKISGSGDVAYVGNPQIDQDISGSGTIEAYTPENEEDASGNENNTEVMEDEMESDEETDSMEEAAMKSDQEESEGTNTDTQEE